jgi:DNA-directed RNA polymerase subunit M/transcription elongation factor TFIIS
MSVERDESNFVMFVCDECGSTLETDERDFYDAVVEKKHEGWRSVKRDDEWEDRCPDCG